MKHAAPSPIAILRKHGKSFYWASFFLGAKKAIQAARLYSFCRMADDLADKSLDTEDAIRTLSLWQKQIQDGHSTVPIVKDILDLASEIKLDKHALVDLLRGLISDLNPIRIRDEAELIQYSYLVAGTVGLMMCGLLGAEDDEAKHFAVDLGIAMQLTNILRDVAEDAQAGRQYIPQNWLRVEINFFRPNAQTSDLAQPVFQRLYQLAELYYQSAYAGMIYLPKRCRLSIMIAARLYREIGLQAKREGFPVLNKRIVVSPARKCWLVFTTLIRFSWELLTIHPFPKHDTHLHKSLAGLQDS